MEQIGHIIKFDNSARVVIEKVCAYGEYGKNALYINVGSSEEVKVKFGSEQKRDDALLKLDEILS